MSASDFGVTAASVRAHHFPNADAWTTSSRPSASAVAEAIEEESAHMAGRLALELVNAADITVGSAAYVACRRILRMQVAIRVIRDMLGQDTELARAWAASVADWYVQLDEGGASFLGDGASATGSSDPDGPTSHISVFGLATDSAADMSNTVPLLRKGDEF